MRGSLCSRFPLLVALCGGTTSPSGRLWLHGCTSASQIARTVRTSGCHPRPDDPFARLAINRQRGAH